MAAFDFPSSPSVNQTYTANGVTWKWNGTMWMRVSGAGYLEKIEEGNSKVEVDDSGSGNVTVTTDGTERLRITSGGDVSIGGLASPRAKLDIEDAGTSKDVILRVSADDNNPYALVVANDTFNTTSNRGFAFWVGSNKVHHIAARTSTTNSENEIMVSAGDAITFRTNVNEERLRITSAGKIGIGHQQEGQITKELTIRPANDGGIRFVRPGATGASVMSHLELTTTTSGSTFPSGEAYTVKYNTINNDQIFTTYEGGGTGGNISFQTGSGSGNEVERLRIDNSGRLGLGVVPEAFHSNNKAVIRGDSGYTILGRGDNSLNISQNFYYDSSDAGKYIANGEASLYNQSDGSHSFYSAASGSANASASMVERLRVFSDGSVRIGDNSITVAAVGSGPTLAINGAAPEITLRDSATNNPYAVMRTNDFGSLTLEADQGNDAANSTIHFRVDNAERMRINSSYLLHGDTASDLSGTHATMFCGSNHAFQHDGDTGTYLTIALGAANGTVDLEADARSGGYPDMRFITTNSERVRIRANGDMTMRGTNSQYVEAAAFEITQASSNAINTNNGGFVSFNSLRNTNSTIISHDPNSNSGRRITFPVAGAVHFSMYQDIKVSGTSGYTQCRLYKNGAADRYALITYTNNEWDSIVMNTVVEVAANDYLEFYYTGGTITGLDYYNWCSYNFVFYPINTNRG